MSTGEIVLVTSGDPERLTGGYLYNRRMLDALEAAGLAFGQVVLQGAPVPAAMLALRAALARQRPAVVVVDSIVIGATAPLVSWMRRRLGARVVALMHMLPSELAPWWRRPYMRYAEHTLLARADRVVAVSPSLGDRLVAAGAAPDGVVVIPPGRDGIPLPTTWRPREGGRRLLCVANWTRSKGIHTLVEAMARVDVPLHLDLVGEEADHSYARHVRALIRRHGLADRVRVLGPRGGTALSDCYAAADVFVLPSESEGFGIVYAEAMSFGLPVVACRVGPLPWLLDEGRCGILVPPHDSVALARAMRVLATDPSLRRELGEAAHRRALRLPTWRQSGEAFCRLVQELSVTPRAPVDRRVVAAP